MKQAIAFIAFTAAIILSGCGAVGVLEEENTELRDKLDSISIAQHTLKNRVEYLESENIALDTRNKQLKNRIDETGALMPPDYTVTSDKPLYAPPVQAVPLTEQGAYRQPHTNAPQPSVTPNITVSQPQTYEPSGGNIGAATPWRAEQSAIRSGAADPRQHAGTAWTYKQQAEPIITGGYRYNELTSSQEAGSPGKWKYGDPNAGSYDSKYSRTFDNRDGQTYSQPASSGTGYNSWGGANARATQPAASPTPVPSPVYTQPEVTIKSVPMDRSMPSIPLPSASVHVTPGEAQRSADYSYLAAYQKGLSAFKDGEYTTAIEILSGLSASSDVNIMSDNCDYWIAESYYALRDNASAKVYYARVLSYPDSDKAGEAQARLNSLR